MFTSEDFASRVQRAAQRRPQSNLRHHLSDRFGVRIEEIVVATEEGDPVPEQQQSRVSRAKGIP